MAGSRHGHSHNHGKADKWTKLEAVGGGIADLVANTYWLGGLIDIAGHLDDAGVGLSWYGLGFGSALAIMIAAGGQYSHYILNMRNQAGIDEENEAAPLLREDINEEDEDDQPRLTWLQKAALAGDFVSHMGDNAAPLVFVAKLATAKYPWSLTANVVTQCGATLFGGLSSVAGTRTCMKSMLKFNQERAAAAAAQDAEAGLAGAAPRRK